MRSDFRDGFTIAKELATKYKKFIVTEEFS